MDLELHSKYVPGGSETIYDVDQRVSKGTQVIPPLPEDRFLCSFSHIFAGLPFLLILLNTAVFPCEFISYCFLWISGGYAAGYYSYKVIFLTFFFFSCSSFLLGSDGWIWLGFISVIGCHGFNTYASFLPCENKPFMMITCVDNQLTESILENKIFHSSSPFIFKVDVCEHLGVRI